MAWMQIMVDNVSSTMGAIAANEQAKADSAAINRQSLIEQNITTAEFQSAQGAEIAKAGGAGTSLTGGSNIDIFTESALNNANTISDIKFASAVESSQLRQAGRLAVISSFGGGLTKGVTEGAMASLDKKKRIADKKSVTGTDSPARASRRANAPQGRSLLGRQGSTATYM